MAAGILNESRLVKGIAVQRNLNVHFVGYGQRAVDCRWRRAPVFVNFQADNPGRDLLTQRIRIRAIAFTQQADIDRQAVRSLQHPRDVPRTRGAGRGVGTRRRAGPPPIMVVTPETSASSACCGQISEYAYRRRRR